MATLAPGPRTAQITVATGSAGPFVIPLRLFDAEALAVYVGTEERADWTVNATFSNGYADDATLTFDVVLPSGSIITIDPLLTPQRGLDYVNTDRALTDKLNIEFPRLWSVTAELRRDMGRTLRTFGSTENVRFPSPGTDGPVGWSGEELISWDNFQFEYPALRTFANRAAVLNFAAQNPTLGTIASHARAAYRYDGVSTAIADLPGWVPEGYVTPWHFGGDPTGVASSRAALLAADAYCIANEGVRLLIDGFCALDAPVSLNATEILCPGRIVVMSSFNPGGLSYVVRLGPHSNLGVGRTNVRLFFDGSPYCGHPVGTWTPASGTFPFEVNIIEGEGEDAVTVSSPVAVGDSFKVRAAGTYAGETFAEGDCLIALVAAPSTTVFAGNWRRIPRINMVRIQGIALPNNHITISGNNCDGLVHAFGNTERVDCDISGRYVHSLLRDETTGASSPDNNAYFIRAGAYGQAYWSSGNPVSDVRFEVQAQIDFYRLPTVSINSTRMVTLRGCIRAPCFRTIEIDQDSDPRCTGVHFADLKIINPDLSDSDNEVMFVTRSGKLTGKLILGQPQLGVTILRGEGHNLTLDYDSLEDGTCLTLGGVDVLDVVKRSRFFINNSRERGATHLLQLNRVEECLIEAIGIPLPVDSDTTSVRTHLVLPSRFITEDVEVSAPGCAVEFLGGVMAVDLAAYSWGAAGMTVRLASTSGLAVYTGTGTTGGWQKPSYINF